MLSTWGGSRIERRDSRNPSLVTLASRSIVISTRLVIVVFCLVTVLSSSTNIRSC